MDSFFVFPLLPLAHTFICNWRSERVASFKVAENKRRFFPALFEMETCWSKESARLNDGLIEIFFWANCFHKMRLHNVELSVWVSWSNRWFISWKAASEHSCAKQNIWVQCLVSMYTAESNNQCKIAHSSCFYSSSTSSHNPIYYLNHRIPPKILRISFLQLFVGLKSSIHRNPSQPTNYYNKSYFAKKY